MNPHIDRPVVAITLTGNRHESFKLMSRAPLFWLNEGWLDKWYVVDDYLSDQTPIPLHENIVKVPAADAYWRGCARNTMLPNLRAALSAAVPSVNMEVMYGMPVLSFSHPWPVILFLEDDEYYPLNYILSMSHPVYSNTEVDVIGFRHSYYLNVKQRLWKRFNNRKHASLCQTALMSHDAVLLFAQCLSEVEEKGGSGLGLDTLFWRRVWGNPIHGKLYSGNNGVVSLKGMPGRVGIGQGHTCAGNGWHTYVDDPRFYKQFPLEFYELYKEYL